MKLVILESPFAGNVNDNIKYARLALRDSLFRGEAPIASHLLYTQDGVLNDEIPEERQHGINSGLAWGKVADETVVYIDKGISKGMEYGIKHAVEENRSVVFRKLYKSTSLTIEDCIKKYLNNKTSHKFGDRVT